MPGSWKGRREMSSTLRHQSLGENKNAIRAAIHCEVVITRANERAICPHIKVLANEGLFIICEHKSSHNPISCLLIPMAGKGEAHLGKRWTKESQQGFGSERGTSTLQKLDQDTRLFGSSATSSHGCIAMKQCQKRFWKIYLNIWVCVLAEHKHGDDDNELWLKFQALGVTLFKQFSKVLSTQVPTAATRGHCCQAFSPPT